MRVDTVLFDLDGTLVEYERSSATVLDRAFERAGVEPFFEVAEFEARYEDFFPTSDSIADLRERVFADIASTKGRDPAVGRAVAREYAAERDHSRVRLLPGAEAVLDAMADRPLGMVTNGDPGMQRPKLEATGLIDHFDPIVYAGHDAPAKPDAAPFHLALEGLGAEPSRAAYVGNDPDADVGGANAAGLTSVWLRNGAPSEVDPDAAYIIDRLDDLLETDLLG
ncbi:MAG: HAD family hydrolase [Halodesulfurarchaeum sp.]